SEANSEIAKKIDAGAAGAAYFLTGKYFPIASAIDSTLAIALGPKFAQRYLLSSHINTEIHQSTVLLEAVVSSVSEGTRQTDDSALQRLHEKSLAGNYTLLSQLGSQLAEGPGLFGDLVDRFEKLATP